MHDDFQLPGEDGGEAAARGKGGMVDGVEAAFASMNPNLKV